MRTFLIPILVVGVALAAGTAFAATDSGTISAVNPNADSITLSDGKVFTLAEGTEAESLKVGQKVSVVYHMKSGKMVATKIIAIK